MFSAAHLNLDPEIRKILSASTQIAAIFDPDEPKIRPEFIMVAICIVKGGVCEWLYDFIASEVPDFKVDFLIGIADFYTARLSDAVHALRKVSFDSAEYGEFDEYAEQIITNACEDWANRFPETKDPVLVDYFLGALLLSEEKFEILDLVLSDCDMDREAIFAYLMSSSEHIDREYPRRQILHFSSNEELQDFLEKMTEANPEAAAPKVDVRDIGTIEAHLRKTIVGQDPAIDAVIRALKTSEAGLKDPVKPVGVFLFAGYTGVGKTELARQLAIATGRPFKRLDMSEYKESHNVMRLYGAPPSYIGYGEGGQLTSFVANSPTAIIVFDEVDKAHPDVMDVVLQLAEEGTLTDGKGTAVRFDQAIIILTTNIGAKDAMRGAIGFDSGEAKSQHSKFNLAMQNFFKPEFLGRMTATIIFSKLSPESLAQITELELAKPANRIKSNRGIALRFAPSVAKHISTTCDASRYGARDIKHAIERDISAPLADFVVTSDVKDGDTITVSYRKKVGYVFARKISS